MADGTVRVAPDSTGKYIDTSEVSVSGNTVERQRVVIADSTNATSLATVKAASTAPATTDPALVVAVSPNSPQFTDVTASGTINGSGQTVSISAAGKNSVGMVLGAGLTSATLIAEVSFDGGTTWVTGYFFIPGTGLTSTQSGSISAGSYQLVSFAGASNYRVRCSAYVSGSAALALRATTVIDETLTTAMLVLGVAGVTPPNAVQIAGVVNTSAPSLSNTAGAALSLTTSGAVRVDLGATGANATAVKVDGSASTQPVSGTVTVQQSTASSLKVDLSGTGANATAIKVDGSAVTQPVSISATVNVTDVPATSGGWSTNVQQALSNAAVTVKASAGQLGGYAIYNPNATVEYVFFYNAASPTIGSTTNLLFQVGVPATSTAHIEFGKGIAFSTGIYAAASASSNSSSTPTSGLIATVFFK